MKKGILFVAVIMLAVAVIAAAATQCAGTTKKGERCRNMTTDPSGYCYLHK